MQFQPIRFIENLHYMLNGMLGIVAVIGIIILMIYLLVRTDKKKAGNDVDTDEK